MPPTAEDLTVGRLDLPRPSAAPGPPPPPGTHRLGLGTRRDGLLVVPPAAAGPDGVPLVVALHGAGGSGEQMVDLLGPTAREHGFVLLAPDSRARTWDVIAGGYGPDVLFTGEAMAHATASVRVDPARTAVCGFSDGASYALSLGIANGDVFSAVVAYSPGFSAAVVRHGAPRIFVAHGVEDRVLPVARCSRRLVPRLRDEGYDVRYLEFAGGHTVPAAVIRESLPWLLGTVVEPPA
jgi:predicted esterase